MKRQWIIDQDNHQLHIDDFAYKHQISKRALKNIKMNGDILVNNVHQTVRYQLNEGDVLTFIYPPEDNQIQAVSLPLHIIYEDAYLLVIDKEKGMPCIPTRAHPTCTLANALSYYYQQNQLSSTVHLVNRLDKDTSGLMIVAKYRDIHDLMCKDIKHILRKYQTHVLGKVDSGIVDLPIYRDGSQMKRIVDERGKPSCTHYRLLTYHDGKSLIECVLTTGRTHQIRVHMSAIGHPLVGDELYGDGKDVFDLDSVMVAFKHPVTKQIKVFMKKKK